MSGARSDTSKLELTGPRHFASWLAGQELSLAFTIYQAGKVFLIGLQPDGTNGFAKRGFGAYYSLGRNLSRAGDNNGDGITIGAARADPVRDEDAGRSCVVFGMEPFGGSISRTFVAFAGCLNVGNGQFVSSTMEPDNLPWNCEAAGLPVNPGDVVQVIGLGIAD